MTTVNTHKPIDDVKVRILSLIEAGPRTYSELYALSENRFFFSMAVAELVDDGKVTNKDGFISMIASDTPPAVEENAEPPKDEADAPVADDVAETTIEDDAPVAETVEDAPADESAPTPKRRRSPKK